MFTTCYLSIRDNKLISEYGSGNGYPVDMESDGDSEYGNEYNFHFDIHVGNDVNM